MGAFFHAFPASLVSAAMLRMSSSGKLSINIGLINVCVTAQEAPTSAGIVEASVEASACQRSIWGSYSGSLLGCPRRRSAKEESASLPLSSVDWCQVRSMWGLPGNTSLEQRAPLLSGSAVAQPSSAGGLMGRPGEGVMD